VPLAAFFVESHPRAPALLIVILNSQGNDCAYPGEGVAHHAEQGAVAQANEPLPAGPSLFLPIMEAWLRSARDYGTWRCTPTRSFPAPRSPPRAFSKLRSCSLAAPGRMTQLHSE
jgi:hypothetical protein